MKKFIIILSVILLLLVVFSPFIFNQAKGIRAGQHLNAALEHKAAGEDEPAYFKIQSAYNLDPENPEILKHLGAYAAEIDHPGALGWWMEAADAGLLERGDLVDLVEYGLESGEADRVRPYLLELVESDPGNEAVQELRLKFLQREKSDYAAYELARDLIREGSLNSVVASTYFYLAFGLPQVERAEREEAFACLKRFGAADGELGLLALQGLFDFWDRLTAVEKAQFEEQLNAHPDVVLEDQLRLLSLRRLDGADAAELLDASRKLYASRKEALPESGEVGPLTVFVNWLNAEGFHEAALDYLEIPAAATDPDLFFARQRALIDVGKAEEAYSRSLEDNPLSPARNLVLRAMALEEMGDSEKVRETLNLMVEVVDIEEVTWVEQILGALNEQELVLKMFEHLAETMESPLPAQLKLLEYYYAFGRGGELSRLLPRVSIVDLEDFPGEKVLLLYLRLLYQQDWEENRQIIEDLVVEFPNVVDFRILLAFAYSLAGQPEEGKSLIAGLDLASVGKQRMLNVMMAYIHVANRELIDGIKYTSGIKPDALLEQERILLRELY